MKAKDRFTAAVLAGKPIPVAAIDIHGHIGELKNYFIPSPDAASMVEVMDSVGVAAIAISAHAAISADYSYGNDVVARAVRDFPGRFIGYATANPHYPSEVEGELRRCFDELGFRMIKLHPGTHEYKLTDKRYDVIYRFAEKHGAPILTHTWEGVGTCSPEVAAEAARRHPSVPFIWGHAGAPSFEKALDFAAELPNVYLDLACSRVFMGTVEHFVKNTPVEKILFASDCPFLSLPQQVAKVACSEVSEADKERILRGNALALLKAAGVEGKGA